MSAILGAWVPDASSYTIEATSTVNVNVTAGRPYWVSGDGTADSAAGDGDLLAILNTALGVTLTLSGETVTTSSTTSVDWSTSTFPGWVLGFGTGTQALNTADPSPLVWVPGDGISGDSRERQRLIRGRRESLNGLVYTSNFGDAAKTREVDWERLNQDRILEEYAGPAARTAFEALDRRSISLGRPLRVYGDATTISAGTGFSRYVARAAAQYQRDRQYAYRWSIALSLGVSA